MEASGDTPLVETIQRSERLLQDLRSSDVQSDNAIVFVFTDGQVDPYLVTKAVNSFLSPDNSSLSSYNLDVRYFQVEEGQNLFDYLSRNAKFELNLGRRFSAKMLKDAAQLATELDELGKSLIRDALSTKIRLALSRGKQMSQKKSFIESKLKSLEDENDFMSQVKTYLEDLKKIEQGWNGITNLNAESIPKEFISLVQKYLQLTQQIDVLQAAEIAKREIDKKLNEAQKVSQEIDSQKDEAEELAAYVIGVQASNTDLYKSLPNIVKAQINNLLRQVYEVQLLSESVNSRLSKIEGREDEWASLKVQIKDMVDTLYALPTKVENRLLSMADGKSIMDAIRNELANQDIHLSRNRIYRDGDEIVLEGVHIWSGNSSGGSLGDSDTSISSENLRNKGIIIDMRDDSGGGPGGQRVGQFINEGTIIRKASLPRWGTRDGSMTLFLNNGQVITLPVNSSTVQGYFWAKRGGNYLIFNEEFNKIEILDESQIKSLRQNLKGLLANLAQRGLIYLKLAGNWAGLSLASVGSRVVDGADNIVLKYGEKDHSGRVTIVEANKDLLVGIKDKTQDANWFVRNLGNAAGATVYSGARVLDGASEVVTRYGRDRNDGKRSLLERNLELYHKWISHNQAQLKNIGADIEINEIYLPIVKEIIAVEFEGK